MLQSSQLGSGTGAKTVKVAGPNRVAAEIAVGPAQQADPCVVIADVVSDDSLVQLHFLLPRSVNLGAQLNLLCQWMSSGNASFRGLAIRLASSQNLALEAVLPLNGNDAADREQLTDRVRSHTTVALWASSIVNYCSLVDAGLPPAAANEIVEKAYAEHASSFAAIELAAGQPGAPQD